MKPFALMYLLIGLAHGIGALEAEEKVSWWEPPLIVGLVGVVWPIFMIQNVKDQAIERAKST
jgi:hypothetical protein